jgi:hypothetical protein
MCSALNSSSPWPPTRAAFLSTTKVAVVVEVTAFTSTYVKKIDDEEYRGIDFSYIGRTNFFCLSWNPVLWIRNILVRIRIRTTGFGSDPAFSSVADKMPTKNNKFFLLIIF